MSKKIIEPLVFCALGNPGTKYKFNRHNVGWQFFSHWSITRSQSWSQKFKGEFAQGDIQGLRRYFIIPHTFMNLSGESVQPLLSFFKLSVSNLVVFHDELDLPVGQVEFKLGGGLAGHNGLKSIAQLTSSQDFLRVRIGIGRPEFGSVSDWVLSDFSKEEVQSMLKVFKKIEDALSLWFTNNDFSAIQSQYNKKMLLD